MRRIRRRKKRVNGERFREEVKKGAIPTVERLRTQLNINKKVKTALTVNSLRVLEIFRSWRRPGKLKRKTNLATRCTVRTPTLLSGGEVPINGRSEKKKKMQVITLNCRVLIKQIKRKLLLKRFKSCYVVYLQKTNVTDLKASEWKKKGGGGGGDVHCYACTGRSKCQNTFIKHKHFKELDNVNFLSFDFRCVLHTSCNATSILH